MKAWRAGLAAAGIALALFGLFRLVTETPPLDLLFLALWLAGALVVHDGLLSPGVVGVGTLLRRFVPDRARRYVQAGLIASGMVTVIAVPMIYLRGSQPAVKALLLRDYGLNLALLVSLIAAVCLVLYVRRVVADRKAAETTRAPRGD